MSNTGADSNQGTEVLIANKYAVEEKIGKGSYGDVFRARDVKTGTMVAVKRESMTSPHAPQLVHEAEVYREICGIEGILDIIWEGTEGEYRVLVMPLCGPNLDEIRQDAVSIGHGLPLSLIVAVGVQMISRMEALHARGYVYRDIKAANVMFPVDFTVPIPQFDTQLDISIDAKKIYYDDMHRNVNLTADMPTPPPSTLPSPTRQGESADSPHITLVDFGLAKKYIDASTGRHIRGGYQRRDRIGTARYASVNIHKGKEHSRRDDIEAVAYLLLELLRGTLPWSGQRAHDARHGWNKMMSVKANIDLEELYEGFPQGFLSMLEYARDLRYEEDPDYNLLRSFIRNVGGDGPEAAPVSISHFVEGTFSSSSADEVTTTEA